MLLLLLLLLLLLFIAVPRCLMATSAPSSDNKYGKFKGYVGSGPKIPASNSYQCVFYDSTEMTCFWNFGVLCRRDEVTPILKLGIFLPFQSFFAILANFLQNIC